MIKYLSARRRGIAIFCCALFLFQLLQPTAALALTGGPTQPEVQSFQPAGTTEMVDLFSGDFSYNIPLFELPGPNGGYPFNLSYQSGIGMDQEASWVGLGWSLNPGAITRQMRGLPDEFKGDDVVTKMDVKPSVTIGLGSGASMEAFGADGLSLTGGFSVSLNNYKGLGYSLDGSVGFARAAGGGMTGGIGLDFSLDSKEGISVQPSLSLSGKLGQIGLGAGYNSKSGLSSISLTHTSEIAFEYKDKKEKDQSYSGSFSNSAMLSLAHPGYTPQITMPMKNLNLAAEFRPGASWWGIFGHLYVRGFYNEQRLDKKTVTTDAYGYMNYQYATDPKALLDVNREKDGLVSKESPNMAMPSLTYDVYSVTGQGISAMYRPMRNDYGIVYDQQVSSVTNGGSVGIDLGAVANHVGVNLSVNHSKSTTGPWKDNNNYFPHGQFQSKNINDLYEPWYFKVHGEPSVENEDALLAIGGDKAVRINLDNNRSAQQAHASIERRVGESTQEAPKNPTVNRERKTRNQVIQTLTNEQLLKGGTEVLPQFRIKYLDESGAEQNYNRSAPETPSHHIAAFTATTPEGLRYNYGLPAYNKKQIEVTFSAVKSAEQVNRVAVQNAGIEGDADPKYKHGTETDELLKAVEIPKYAHSHLLTSILGPDYVDLTNDGVTKDDLGYWVKFTYQKRASTYKWRDPFFDAHYNEGWKTDPRDDKGSFVYGEKELWYMATVETKSHVAKFFMSDDRLDGKGVSYQLQREGSPHGAGVPKLEQIKLYSRFALEGPLSGQVPLKIVKFIYDQSLCQELYGTGTTGKLTLKELQFLYGGSTKGELNPYRFTYGNNPKYDNLSYDRWGNYKPYEEGEYDHNRDFPYVPQDPAAKAELDANASAWSLKKIDLPSGGQIIVDYETDDYAYVQHKPAMQMMEIVDPENFTNSTFSLKDDLLKVRFKLESTVNGSIDDPSVLKAEVLKYLGKKPEQLYFKIRIDLRKAGENFKEDICGYATINNAGPMGLEKDGTGSDYTHGYFHVLAEEGNKNALGQVMYHHPFSKRAWQHLRTNQPELASQSALKSAGVKVKETSDKGERIKQIKSMGSIVTHVRQMFKGFYKFCAGEAWGREVKVGKSWIRLYSPDKIKYGGGLRVKQITMKDQWAEDEEGVYGQVYEYTTVDEDGNTISSGVASYEPMVGGDENPLRYAKKFVQSVPLRADNNLYFEYPINETYFPGAQVGYGKVTVWSLASAALAERPMVIDNIPPGLFPNNTNVSYGTTGKTEHEFYTARDFPVITDETEKYNRPFNLSIPVPFLGNLSISNLAATQGYSIITNDMHGKPKKLSNYRQNKAGDPEPTAMSWIQYNYHSEPLVYQNEKVNKLLNTLKENNDKTLSLPVEANASLPNVILGQETEFFTDMRQYSDKSWAGGARVNLDINYVPFPIPIPTVWPSIGKTQNQLRMSVTNKVIFKTGILVSIVAYDGSSQLTTSNEKWDKLTGVPVLTKTNNNFDDYVYNYSILSHSQYKGMGAAYQNAGLTFDISSVAKDTYKKGYYDFYCSSAVSAMLYPGDEIILYENAGELTKPVAKAVYTGAVDGDNFIYTTDELTAKDYKCLIVRSGFRNQLAVSAGTLTGLQDPSIPGVSKNYEKKIIVIK